MHPKAVREHLRQQPFEPIRIHMSDGSFYDVPHPDFAMVTKRYVLIGVDPEDDEIPLHLVFCDPVHITRIEPVPRASRKRRRKRE